MKHNYLLLFFIISITSQIVLSVDIGSDFAVQRFYTHQIINNGDRIAGFSALTAGFTLDNVGVNALYDSLMPISGDIVLNGGTLTLNRDLFFSNETNLVTLGNIIGRSHTIDFASTMTVVPSLSSIEAGDPGSGFYSGGIGAGQIEFLVGASLPDDVNSVSWSPDGLYIAAVTENNGGNELVVYQFNNVVPSLTFRAGVSLGNAGYSISWHPINDWVAVGRNSYTGNELFIYQFNRGPNTLTLLDSVSTADDINSVAWHPSGSYLALARDSDTQEVMVYSVNGSGILGTSISVNMSGTSNAEVIAWSPDGSFLAVGRSGDTELSIYSFTVGPLALTLNASIDTGSVAVIAWHPTQPVLAVGLTSGTNRLLLYSHDSSMGILSQLTTGVSTGISVLGLSWNPVNGYLMISKANNNEGTGAEIIVYRFDNPTLSESDGVELGSNVNTVSWSPNGDFAASGDLANNLNVYGRSARGVDTTILQLSDSVLSFNGDTTLRTCNVRFSGKCFINGKGGTLDLASTATIHIGNDSTLMISDLTLRGLQAKNLQCDSVTSKLILDNVTLELADNYLFDKGSIDVQRDVIVWGNGFIFTYQSPGLFTISNQAGLTWDEGITFSYDCATSDRFKLVNNSSSMVLNRSTLYATLAGLNLINGQLIIRDDSILVSEYVVSEAESGEVTLVDHGITLGDGTSAHDLKLVMQYNTTLQVLAGTLNYRNVNQSSLRFLASEAVLRIGSNAKFNLYENLNSTRASIIFENNARFAILKGKELTAFVRPEGRLERITIPESIS